MRNQTIFQAGNSLAVSLPSSIVKKLGLATGQKVICQPSVNTSKITYEFPDAKQLPLLASINPANSSIKKSKTKNTKLKP
jgi:antitoxin component of MazEF toxin-antitoxin module